MTKFAPRKLTNTSCVVINMLLLYGLTSTVVCYAQVFVNKPQLHVSDVRQKLLNEITELDFAPIYKKGTKNIIKSSVPKSVQITNQQQDVPYMYRRTSSGDMVFENILKRTEKECEGSMYAILSGVRGLCQEYWNARRARSNYLRLTSMALELSTHPAQSSAAAPTSSPQPQVAPTTQLDSAPMAPQPTINNETSEEFMELKEAWAKIKELSMKKFSSSKQTSR